MTGFIEEPQRRVPIVAEADVVVLGGGPAGIAAATSAARHGARTVLIERYGFLGGAGTAAMVTNFCGLYAKHEGEFRQVVYGLAEEILDRIGALGGLGPFLKVLRIESAVRCYDNAVYKCAADDMLLGAGVKILFHATAVGAVVRDGVIEHLLVETKSGRGAIEAKTFIDCSGDADLAAWAGAPYEKGAEDGFMAFPTLMFRMGNVDTERAEREGKPSLAKLMEESEARGEGKFPRRAMILNPQPHKGEWRANVTQISRPDRHIDGTQHEDLVHAEIEGRRQALRFSSFLRDRVPGFESSYLLELAPQVGIRETRRVLAVHQLTGAEVVACSDFSDAIGANCWPIEEHALGGIKWTFLGGRGYCQVPFTCLVPREVRNLLVAGRCAGATREAQASTRVSGPCFVMGQAAGTAAALAMKSACPPSGVAIGALQAALRTDNVFIEGTPGIPKGA